MAIVSDVVDLDVTPPTAAKGSVLDHLGGGKFTEARIETYSVSMTFLKRLFDEFGYDHVRVIFGERKFIEAPKSKDIAGAARRIRQAADLERTDRDTIKIAQQFMDQIGKSGWEPLLQKRRIEFWCMPTMSHKKVFLLEGKGAKRIIFGSSNATKAGCDGNQREVIAVSSNRDLYEYFLADFQLHQVDQI